MYLFTYSVPDLNLNPLAHHSTSHSVERKGRGGMDAWTETEHRCNRTCESETQAGKGVELTRRAGPFHRIEGEHEYQQICP